MSRLTSSWRGFWGRKSARRHSQSHRERRKTRSLLLEPLERRELLSLAPQGDETLANGLTAGSQVLSSSGSAVAAMPEGGFLVAYSSQGQDGSGWGVYGQRFDAAGRLLGEQFRLNSTTAGDQQRAGVSAGPDGTVVAVWQSAGQDGSGSAVIGRRFTARGRPLGREFMVNTTTADDQDLPAVAHLADGRFVVVWSGRGRGDNEGVFGRLYDAEGKPQGAEFSINTCTPARQRSPVVAGAAEGGFVVAWESDRTEGGTSWDILGQRFDANGSKWGGEFLVNRTVAESQRRPAIAAGPQGGFVIAWQSAQQDSRGDGIFAQRFDAAGRKQGREFQVNSTIRGDQQDPAVTFDARGGFLVTWSGRGRRDTLGIFGRKYGPQGVPEGGEFLVNSTADGIQDFPSAVAAGGGYVLAWSGQGSGDVDGVFVRRFGSPPVSAGIQDVYVGEDAHRSEVDLRAAFEDADNADRQLTFEVTANTNPDLFRSIKVPQGRLKLVYARDALGTAQITVRATDPGGLFGEATFTVHAGVADFPPQIVSLSDTPDAVIEGGPLTLEAIGVSDDNEAVRVAFYRDADGDGVLDTSVDQLLEVDTSGSDGWSAQVSTAGFGRGPQRYFAQATDDAGQQSAVVSETGEVGIVTYMDDGDPGYEEVVSGWTSVASASAFDGEFREHAAGIGENKARWTFTGLARASYTVSATWLADAARAGNAPFAIYDGDELLTTVAVNQRAAPNDLQDQGAWWDDLGTFVIQSGTVVIELSDDADGAVAADAIRLKDPPTAEAGGPYYVAAGSTVTLDGSGSWGPDPIVSYAWDLDGDGLYGETGTSAERGDEVGAQPVFSCPGTGFSTATVYLQVTDSNQMTSTDTATVYLKPTVTVAATQNACEGYYPSGYFTFTRDATDGGLTVYFSISASSTATRYTDYDYYAGSSPESVYFSPGSSTATLWVWGYADSSTEGDETVILDLETGSGYELGAPGSATMYVIDSAPPVVTVAATQNAPEGGPSGYFTFTRDRTDGYLTVYYSISASSTATLSTDYSGPYSSGSVYFASGSSTTTLWVSGYADGYTEDDETVILDLELGSDYELGYPSSATMYVIDSAPPVVTVAATQNAPEGGPSGYFTFTRNHTDGGLTVYYSINSSSTATLSTDYSGPSSSGSVYFTSGSSTATLWVWGYADSSTEGDETVILDLETGSGYELGAPSSATMYVIDSAPPVVTVAATQNAAEGGPSGYFTFTRDRTDSDLTVYYSINSSSTATLSTDYSGPDSSGSVYFTSGSSTATLWVWGNADGSTEGDETVIVDLETGSGYTLGDPSSATMYVIDAALPVVTVAATQNAQEGGPSGYFTFSRDRTDGYLTAYYSIGANSTATLSTDYSKYPSSDLVTFMPGESTATAYIDPVDDSSAEGNETVVLLLSTDASYTVGCPGDATLLIVDNDTDGVGPHATQATPTGDIDQALDRFTLTFSEPIQDGSFTLADVASLTGPQGAIAPVAVNRLSAEEYEVVFAVQTALGSYTVVVGPEVYDLAGNPMNQDQDASNGEPTEDQFTAGTVIVEYSSLPRIGSASPAGHILGPIDRVTLTFDRAVQDGTFTLADVMELSGPGGAITPLAVNRLGDTQYEVTFASQTALGEYLLTVGPDILDLNGHAMDQDQDGTPGEVPDDRFSHRVTVSVPAFEAHFDFGTGTSPLAAGYSRIAATSPYLAVPGYGWQSGTIHEYDRGVGTSLTRDFNYSTLATFAVAVPAGGYTVTVVLGDTGTYLHDQMGVFLEGTQVDSVTTPAGTVVTRIYTVSVTDGQLTLLLDDLGGSDSNVVIEGLDVVSLALDTAGARVVQANPPGQSGSPVDHVQLTFSEPILEGSFTVADVVELSGPAGPITPLQVNRITDTQYEVTFSSQTEVGQYQIAIGPEVLDRAGHRMDQDADGVSGEPADDLFTAGFTVEVPEATARFDFGTATSPVAQGFTRVAKTTSYSPSLGYGWKSGTIGDYDRGVGVGTDLTRDFNYSTLATFAVDVPNGPCNVTLTLGNLGPYYHDLMGIYLEGAWVGTVSTPAGEVVSRTYVSTVSDGQLTLLLDDLGGGDPNVVIEGLEVTCFGAANHAPVVEDQTFLLAENADDGVVVGTVLASDPDSGQTLSYTILGGDPQGVFAIDGQTGQITVAQAALLDFETAPAYSLSVEAHDSGSPSLADTATITVNLSDVNDLPTLDPILDPAAIDEDAPQQTINLSGITAGGEASQALQVTAVSGNPSLILDPTVSYTWPESTGTLRYTPLADQSGTAVITVMVRDAGMDQILGNEDDGTFQRTFTITVNAVNDPPTDIQLTDAAVSQSGGASAEVGALSAIDVDNASHTFSLVAGEGDADNALFQIVGVSLQAVDASSTAAGTYSVRIGADDGAGGTYQKAFSVTVVDDVLPSPICDSDESANGVPEGSVNGTLVGVTAHSEDLPPSTVTYTLTDDAGGRFAIDGVTGVVRVADEGLLDFETAAGYQITVRAADAAGNARTEEFSISVVNVAPSGIDDTGETGESSSTAGNVLANDSDPNGPAEVLNVTAVAGESGDVGQSVAGSAGGLFVVAPDGAWSFDPYGQFEDLGVGAGRGTSVSYTLSDGTATATATLTVTVTGENDAPVAADDAALTDAATAVVIGVTANDDDDGDLLEIVAVDTTGTWGTVTVNPDRTITYDPNGQFDWLVMDLTEIDTFLYTISDAHGLTSTAVVQVTITAAPVDLPPELAVFDENWTAIADDLGSVSFGETHQGVPLQYTFNVANWGQGDLVILAETLVLPAGFSLVASFQDAVLSPGDMTSLVVQLDAAATGSFSGQLSFETNDAARSPFQFTVSGLVMPDDTPLGVYDVRLVSDTGYSTTDRVTSDPTVTGTVWGDFGGGTVRVEFDHDADRTAEGSVEIVSSGAAFTYDPRDFDATLEGFAGTLSLLFRYVKYDGGGVVVETGPWQVFSMTLQADADPDAIRVEDFHLVHGAWVSDVYYTGYDAVTPEVTGVVQGDFNGGYVQVQFDLDSDHGAMDGSVIVTAGGAGFEYDSAALQSWYGSVTMYYRTQAFEADGDPIEPAGDWTEFDFRLVGPPYLYYTVNGLGLLDDTGEADGVSSDPTLTGTVSGSGGNRFVTVEFSYDGDDNSVEGSVVAAEGGSFSYLPAGLVYGQPTSVKARVVSWDEQFAVPSVGQWSAAFQFTWQSDPPPPVAEFTLADGSTAGGTTANPVLVGRLDDSDEADLAFVHVQFYLDLQSPPIDETWADATGHFVCRPQGLPAGIVTVWARAHVYDEALLEDRYGTELSLSFTYQLPAGPGITGLEPQEHTAFVTSEPVFVGQVTGDGDVDNVQIEFDHDGDDDPDGFAWSASDGTFTYYAGGLTPGPDLITLRARTAVWNDQQGDYVFGPWASVGFTFQAPSAPAVTVAELSLANDTGDSDTDLTTTDPTLAGRVTGDGSLAYLKVEFNYDGVEGPDGSTFTDGLGYFTFSPTGLPAGQVTVLARALQWDYTAAAYVTGAWSEPLVFTLEIPAPQLPSISEIHLLCDTGTSTTDGYTANPTLAGQLVGDGDLSRVTIEFDHSGSDEVEAVNGTAQADAEGKFYYRPAALGFGSISIKARPKWWDDSQGAWATGTWSSVEFVYEDQPNAAAVLASLALANDTQEGGLVGHTADATLTGRIINEGSLEGVSIELRYDSDPPVDQTVTTDAWGDFTVSPGGLAYGPVTVYARTRELDPVTNQLLYSDPWSEFSFTYVEHVNQAPVATELKLVNDLDETGTAPHGTDPTFSGLVTNDGSADSLLVEYRVGDDQTVRGTTLTDADGNFTFWPEGLDPGTVTLYVRAKEYDDQSTPTYGDWVSFQFTLDASAAESLEITSLALMSDTGIAGDGATSVATVSGQAVVPEGVSSLTVEFDHDGDGLSDGTATTDSSGNFSYTPAGLTEGRVTLRARAVDESGGWPEYGWWKPLSFVYSSDPDGAEAQAIVAAFQQYDEDWQAADDGYQAALAAADAAYRSAWSAAGAAFDSAAATAGAARRATTSAADSTYRTALTSADAGYAAALGTAGTDFATSLASFSGDTTAFDFREFTWPDAPAANRLTIPDDASQPSPPMEAPGYTGSAPDFSQDKTYVDSMAAAETTYQSSLRTAERDLAGKQRTAEITYRGSAAVAYQAYADDVKAAQAEYKNALQASTPPVDMAQEIAAHQARIQPYIQAYDEALAAATLFQNNSEFFGQLFLFPVMGFADMAYAQPSYEYGVDAWGQYRPLIDRLQRAQRDRDIAVADSERILEEQRAELDRWTRQREIDARKVLETEIADAAKTLAERLADAERIKADTIALAAKERTVALANAQIALWQNRLAAKQAAVNRWHQGETAAWIDYQKALVANEAAYLSEMVTRYLTRRTAEAEAVYGESQHVAQADKERAYAIAPSEHDRSDAQAEARRSFCTNSNNAEKTRTVANARLWKSQREGFAIAQYDFDSNGIAVNQEQAMRNADLDMQWVAQAIQIGVQYPTPSPERTAAMAALERDHYDGEAEFARDWKYGTLSLRDTRAEALAKALRGYEVGYHAAEFLWTATVADKSGVYEIGLARADQDYSTDLIEQNGKRDQRAAAERTTRTQTVAQAEKTYRDALAQLAGARSTDDTADFNAFRADQAVAYASTVGNWAAQETSAWAWYQLDLAEAEVTRVTSFNTADAQYAADLAAAEVRWTGSVTTADQTQANAEAEKYETRTGQEAEAHLKYARSVADATIDRAAQKALATTSHDRTVAAQNLVYQNAVSREQETLQNALDEAQWVYMRHDADATYARSLAEDDLGYDWTTGAIVDTNGNGDNYDEWWAINSAIHEAYDDTMDAWQTVKLQSQADAEITRANHVAAARKEWTEKTSDARVTWVTRTGQAESDLAEKLTQHTSTLADELAAAEKTYSADVALAVKAQSVAYAAADEVYANDTAAADAAYRLAATGASSAARESFADARAGYEAALYQAHYDALNAAWLADPTPSAAWHRAAAQADLAWAQSVRTARNTYEDGVTAATLASVIETNTLELAYAEDRAAADKAHAEKLAEAVRAWSTDTAAASADRQAARDKADPKHSEDVVKANAAYDVAQADAQRGFDNLLAAADVVWVQAMAPAWAVYDQGGPLADYQAAWNAATGVHDQSYHAARTAFLGHVGDAQITQAGSLGDAAVTLVTSQGTAENAFTTATNDAEAAYASAVSLAENALAHDTADAQFDYATAQATAAYNLAAYLVNGRAPSVVYQESLGSSDATHAGAMAQAAGDYHAAVAGDEAAALAALATQSGTPQAQYDAAYAAARAAWFDLLTPDFVAYAAAVAQAQADYETGLTQTAVDQQIANVLADIAYTASAEPLAETRAINETSTQQSHDVASVTRRNTWFASRAAGDKDRGIALAQAERAHAVDLAEAEKAYQLALDAEDPDAEADKTAALADADLTQAIAEADADLAWLNRTAEADKAYITSTATAEREVTVALAGIESLYSTLLAPHIAARDVAYAVAGAGYGTDEVEAANQRASDNAEAEVAWWSALYADQATAVAAMTTTLGTPCAGFIAAKTAARYDWWQGMIDSYLDSVADVNAEHSQYQTTVGAEYVSRATDTAHAEAAWTTAAALAVEARNTAKALADEGYRLATDDPGETHVKAVAQAERNYRTTVATAQRNLDRGADDAGQPFAQSEYDAAMSAAQAVKEQAIAAAKSAYAALEVAARQTWRSALADADQDYTLAMSRAIDGDTGGADLLWTRDQGQASQAYNTVEATAYAGLLSNVATVDSTYRTTAADAYAATLGDLATESGTPWAQFEADKASARADYVGDVSTAEVTLHTQTADAERDSKIAAADAWYARTTAKANATAQANRDRASAAVNAATARGAADVALQQLNQYDPSAPIVPVVPAADVVAVNAVAADDYFSASSDADCQGVVSFMFTTVTDEEIEQTINQQRLPSQLTEDLLTERLIRSTHPTFALPEALQTAAEESRRAWNSLFALVTPSQWANLVQAATQAQTVATFSRPLARAVTKTTHTADPATGNTVKFDQDAATGSVTATTESDVADETGPQEGSYAWPEAWPAVLDPRRYANYGDWKAAYDRFCEEHVSELDRFDLGAWHYAAGTYYLVLFVRQNREKLEEARDYYLAQADYFRRLDELESDLAARVARSNEHQMVARNEPAPGEYNWRTDPNDWRNRQAAKAWIEWAFDPANVDDPEAIKIRARLYSQHGMFSPFLPMPPRQDIQVVLKGAGMVPVVGAPCLAVDAGIHYYHGEYVEGTISLAGVAADAAAVALEARLVTRAAAIQELLNLERQATALPIERSLALGENAPSSARQVLLIVTGDANYLNSRATALHKTVVDAVAIRMNTTAAGLVEVAPGEYEVWVSANRRSIFNKFMASLNTCDAVLPERGFLPLADTQLTRLRELVGARTRLGDAEKILIIEAAIENRRLLGIATQDGRLICPKCQSWADDLWIELLSPRR